MLLQTTGTVHRLVDTYIGKREATRFRYEKEENDTKWQSKASKHEPNLGSEVSSIRIDHVRADETYHPSATSTFVSL